MSYKNKKTKKGIINQLKRKIGLIRIALLRKIKSLNKKQITMQQQTRTIMAILRERARLIRKNNLRISEWVDNYLDECILNGKPVEILTQYCLSKDLEVRYETQGKVFIPLPKECEMFKKIIPSIIKTFKENGLAINWYITFNNSFLDRGRVSNDIIDNYISMIRELVMNDEIVLLDWEKDILGKRPSPNLEVMTNFEKLVSQKAFNIDMQNLLNRVKQYPDFSKTETDLKIEAKFKGRFIFSKESPFSEGNILITPLEFPERLVFFETLVPDFQKRILPILDLYPWRMDANKLYYSQNSN
jgi:hypothetical protein